METIDIIVKGETVMNDMISQSQTIATQIQNMIPASTFKNVQSAIGNMCVPKVKINTALIEYTKSFERITPPTVVYSIVPNMMNNMLISVHEKLNELHKTVSSCIQKMAQINFQFLLSDGFIEMQDRMLFFKIAEEIGFPVYLECDTELQEYLIESYRENNNNCNIREMQQIVMNYYNEEYVDNILNGFVNENIFKKKRTTLLAEWIEVYHHHFYGAANALFITQMSGVIRDIYDELSENHKFTKKEKDKIKTVFKLEYCKDNSEKVMLAEVISEQKGSIMVWCHVIKYFLDYIYKSGERNMNEYPKRHMICHGIQTNFNTKEMSLKIILCLDILAELALRAKRNISQGIIDI